MAVITSAASGNFSAGATWVGGIVPGANDDAVAANGHTIAIDVNVTVLSFQQAGTGKFTLGNGRTVTGNVIANAGTTTSGGTMEVTVTAGNSATLNGNVTGVSTTSSVVGIITTGLGSFTLNGNVTGSTGNAPTVSGSGMVYSAVSNTITINGNLIGGATNKPAVHIGAASGANTALTVNGDVTGGTGNNGCGIISTNGFANVTVNVNATTIQGGSGGQAINPFGTTGTVTIVATTITGGSGSSQHAISVNGASFTLTVTAVTIQGGSGISAAGVSHGGANSTAVLNINATTIVGGTANSATAVVHGGSSGVTNVTAVTIQGGSAINAHGIAPGGNSGSCIINAQTIQGSATASARGIQVGTASMTCNATTLIQGGGGSTADAIQATSNGTYTITAPSIEGGIGTNAHGINATNASGVVVSSGHAVANATSSHGIISAATSSAAGVFHTGSITDSTSGMAGIYARFLRLTNSTGTTTYATPGSPTGSPHQRLSPDQSPGVPAVNNVRSGTVYGSPGTLIGTLVVPAANQVAVGVAVDNTVGTAVLTASTLRAAVGLASANLDAQFAAINVDLTPVLNRLPSALVGGRMDSVVADTGTVATNVQAIKAKTDQLAFTVANQVDANSLTGGLTQAQIRTAVGLSSANLDTQLGAIDDYLDTEIAAIKAKTDLITSGNISVLQDRVSGDTITMQYLENTSVTVPLNEDTTALTLQFVVSRPDGTDVLSIANGSIARTSTDFTVTINTAVTATLGQYSWCLRDVTTGDRAVGKGVLTVQAAAAVDA